MTDNDPATKAGIFDMEAEPARIDATRLRQQERMKEFLLQRQQEEEERKPSWLQQADPRLLILLPMIATAGLVIAGRC